MAIDADSLRAAFRLVPEEAMRYLSDKELKPTRTWRDFEAGAHDHAFTVARSAGFDVLNDIRDALLKAQRDGTPYRDFAKNLTPVLQAKGWWGKAVDAATGEIDAVNKKGTPAELGSPRRLKTIYGTNLQRAYMEARYKTMLQATDTHPWWQWVAVMDKRTRPSHAAQNGMTYRTDDPIWSVATPPCGFNCRCQPVPISAWRKEKEGLAESKGQIVESMDEKGRPRRGVRNASTGKTFWPDPGFDQQPGFATLQAQQTELLLRKAASAPARVAAAAVQDVLAVPTIRADYVAAFGAWAEAVEQPRGVLRHVGVLTPGVVEALQKRAIVPESAVLSVRDVDVLHTHRDGKTGSIPWDWYKRLPAHLIAPKAVLLDRAAATPTLMLVFDTPDKSIKLVVRVDYAVKLREGTLKANIIRTGKMMDAKALRDGKTYDLLEGNL